MIQQQIAATQPPSPPGPVEEPAAVSVVEQPAGAPESAKEFVPSRIHLVALVAHEFGVSQCKAEEWLVGEFGGAA